MLRGVEEESTVQVCNEGDVIGATDMPGSRGAGQVVAPLEGWESASAHGQAGGPGAAAASRAGSERLPASLLSIGTKIHTHPHAVPTAGSHAHSQPSLFPLLDFLLNLWPPVRVPWLVE